MTSNNSDENIIIYTEGMTVNDLAISLGVNGVDIVKKLISLGLMLNLNQPISFENAEIVALDYGKTLKKEEIENSLLEEYIRGEYGNVPDVIDYKMIREINYRIYIEEKYPEIRSRYSDKERNAIIRKDLKRFERHLPLHSISEV